MRAFLFNPTSNHCLPPERRARYFPKPANPKPVKGKSYRSAAMRVMRKITMKMKNRMRAMPAAADATPPKPNTPATNAMTAKMSAQVSMPPADNRNPGEMLRAVHEALEALQAGA